MKKNLPKIIFLLIVIIICVGMAFSTISLDEKNKKQSNEIKNLTKEIQTLEKEKIELE